MTRTSDGGGWRVVLGEGESTAGQDVLLFQVFELQDVNLTFNSWKSRVIKFYKDRLIPSTCSE